MSFKNSLNYMWHTNNVLGTGATAKVYKGVDKNTGEPVAIKMFMIPYEELIPRAQSVRKRELDLLRSIAHENIVKLLAIEYVRSTEVIVLELGMGNLLNVLQEPENAYGFQDKEFLLVLKHLTAGIEYLQENNVVHRDLKPANILKFVNEDGTTTYKLTDFGTARELPEGEQFHSICGTDEYVHPEIYRKMLCKTDSTFGAAVDLWSFGATLYHVATGNFPFQAHGGRNNPRGLFHIITMKESGVISGIQSQRDGPIRWDKELPKTCQLSIELKKIITPLLAGLLELDPEKQWSFDKSFNEVNNLLLKKEVNIFYINSGSPIKIFLHPEGSYKDLINYIEQGITENPVLLSGGNLVSKLEENSMASNYLETTEENPLFLFDMANSFNQTPSQLPEYTEFFHFLEINHMKRFCISGYAYKRHIEKLSCYCMLIRTAVESFLQFIASTLTELFQICLHLEERTIAKIEIIEIISMTHNFGISDQKNELKSISNMFLTQTCPKIKQLFQKNVNDNALRSEWESLSRSIKYPTDTSTPARASTQMKKIRDCWEHFKSNKGKKLDYNEQLIQTLQKDYAIEAGKKMRKMLEEDCIRVFSSLRNSLDDWMKIVQTIYIQCTILEMDVLIFQRNLAEFSKQLDGITRNMKITDKFYKKEMKIILQKAETLCKDNSTIIKENKEIRDLFEKLISETSDVNNED